MITTQNYDYVPEMISQIKRRIDALPLLFEIPERAEIEIHWHVLHREHQMVVSGLVRGQLYHALAHIDNLDGSLNSVMRLYKSVLKMITKIAMV